MNPSCFHLLVRGGHGYCGEETLVECNRCHTPVCNDHFEIFRGYKVCLDCYVERRGNLGELRRRMNR
jgi:hypothetical protein